MGKTAIKFGNPEAEFITAKQAENRYNLCYAKIMKLAKESGALIRIGGSTRINVKLMDSGIMRYAEK